MQSAQNLRAFLRRRTAMRRECAFGGFHRASRIFLISQRDTGDHLPVGITLPTCGLHSLILLAARPRVHYMFLVGDIQDICACGRT